MEIKNEKSEFLSNQPLGEDLLKGQSQDKVAEAIMQHILEEDNATGDDGDDKENNAQLLPRIIGVEGSWGSGKSNMLLQLQNKLKDNYHFFTYDAWGNQEDLQRRSILELLTQKLIDEEMLAGETQIMVLNTDLDKEPTPMSCSWKRRLFSLVSRKSTTHNVTIPKVESSTKAFALMLVVSAIAATMMGAMKPSEAPCWYAFLTLLGTLVPFLIFMLCKVIYKWDFDAMWKMYQTEGTKDSTTYTISELEPSVNEFRTWMTDLENSFAPGKKLVIVFDNMDRLPKEKVRQLWSSIQTFFAGKGYHKVWCIIPFDRAHLANAFSEDSDPDKRLELTNYFIEKTFPVVYRIPDPIIADYRGVFDELFKRAFGERSEMELINRCYRLQHGKPNMREIISFINKCVALSHTWGDKISLTSIALFVLKSDTILKGNTDQIIIDGDYADGYGNIIEVNEKLTTEISALVYGVEKERAAQLPLKNIIRKAFAENATTSFDSLAKGKDDFYIILDEETKGLEVSLLDNAINHISEIKVDDISAENKDLLNKVWRKMAELYGQIKQNETVFRNEVRLLMDHCPDTKSKESVGKKFLELFATGDKNEHKGEEWFRVYKEFDTYVKGTELKVTLISKQLKPDSYLSYVREAKDAYKNYPINCNAKEFVDSAIAWMKEGVLDILVIRQLKADKSMDFSRLMVSARETIEKDQATNDNIENVLAVCKELADGPLNLKTNLTFLNTLSLTNGVRGDLILLRVVDGANENMTDEDVNNIVNIAGKYVSTQEMLNKVISTHTPAQNAILKALIEKNVHTGNLEGIKNLLGQLSNICSFTQASKDAVLKFINDCGVTALTPEEQGLSLESTLNEEWIKALESDKHAYSKAILSKYYTDFAKVDAGRFFNAQNQWLLNFYWRKMLKVMIDDADFKATKPANMKEIVKRLIQSICSGKVDGNHEDAELHRKLLQWVEFKDVSSTVHDEVSKFGTAYTITEFKFMALRHYIERLEHAEERILNYILLPIIKNTNVQDVILQNRDKYEPLFKNHIEQASNLRDALIKIHEAPNEQNAEFKAFIDRIGVVVEDKNPKES